MFGIISSGVSHSDGSCVLGRIHSDVSSNIPKKVYHIVTDNFVNLLHISYAWLYKTEFWGRKFHAFSFNSHRNCKIFMTNFNFIFDTICVPYIFRKSIFGWNCDHDTPLCDTPLLEDTPLCDTPDDIKGNFLLFLTMKIETCTLRNNKVMHQNVKCGRGGAGRGSAGGGSVHRMYTKLRKKLELLKWMSYKNYKSESFQTLHI